jgi:hypothetical protein
MYDSEGVDGSVEIKGKDVHEEIEGNDRGECECLRSYR